VLPYCQQIGSLGERIAAEYLHASSYRVIRRNYRKRVGEIDIVALDKNGELVFLEVKARSNQRFGAPYEAVDSTKQQKLIRTISSFLQENQALAQRNFRIDVLSIRLDFSNRQAAIEHIKHAVEDIE